MFSEDSPSVDAAMQRVGREVGWAPGSTQPAYYARLHQIMLAAPVPVPQMTEAQLDAINDGLRPL